MLEAMKKKFPENVFYLISDYVEVIQPEDVDKNKIAAVYEMMKGEEIRNVQIELAQSVRHGYEDFIKIWNTKTKIDALHNKENDYFSVTNFNTTLESL